MSSPSRWWWRWRSSRNSAATRRRSTTPHLLSRRHYFLRSENADPSVSQLLSFPCDRQGQPQAWGQQEQLHLLPPLPQWICLRMELEQQQLVAVSQLLPPSLHPRLWSKLGPSRVKARFFLCNGRSGSKFSRFCLCRKISRSRRWCCSNQQRRR